MHTRDTTPELRFYLDEIAPSLPPRILDFHAHIWRKSDWRAVPWKSAAPGGGYMVTEEDYTIERLLDDARRIFVGREYRAVCFGYPTPSADNEKDTLYAASAGVRRGLYPLMIAGAPLRVPAELLRRRVEEHGFLGFKVHLPWHGDDYGATSVQDMISSNEMQVANELGLIVLLHVPRSGRLADPEIQRGVRWLSETWPSAKIVLAHCGRCYLPAEMVRALGAVRDLTNVYLDTSMVMDETVLRIVFDRIDSTRVLFATDFPVAAMRGRRVRVMDHWVDVVAGEEPPSAFRVPAEGIRATFMALEIAYAVRTAAERAGLSMDRIAGLFYANGMAVLKSVMGGSMIRRVEQAWGAAGEGGNG
jgi:predicted TIM-barrel fold metal-dependent hydrolase